MPKLPDFLVALTSGAALTYLGAKAVTRQAPTIATVVPKRARAGETVLVHGTNFTVGPDGAPPDVTVDGDPAVATMAKRQRVPGDEVTLAVKIPEHASAGTGKALVVRPRGGTASASATVDIVEMSISGVEPAPIVWASGELVTINGSGFGPASQAQDATVTIGDVPVKAEDIVERTDTRLRVRLPTDELPQKPPTKELLVVERGGETPARASYAVALQPPKIVIEKVIPDSVEARAGAKLHIIGSGFGAASDQSLTVTLDGRDLDLAPLRSDTHLVASLGADALRRDPKDSLATIVVDRQGWEHATHPLKVLPTT